MFVLLLQKGPSCWAAPLPKSSCQPGDWKQCCHCTSRSSKHWRVVLIPLWMVFLSPGPWGRPDPCAAVAATLQEPAAPAPELSSRHCWYLALRTCHLKVSLRWMPPEWLSAAWSHGGSSEGRTAPGHTWGCPVGLEDTTNTGQLCLCPRHGGCSAEHDTTMLWQAQLSCSCLRRVFQCMVALHTWSTSLKTKHRAKLFWGICVIQGVLSSSFALMKFSLYFRDKVLLFETYSMALWIMDCWDSGTTKGEGTQPVTGRTSSGLSTLRLPESPQSHRDQHFPPFLFRIAGALESR